MERRRPAILAVDDDPDVARAVQRDLRRRYGDRFQIVGAASGPAAIELLGRLALREQRVALVLADQRMPEMDGVELLAHLRGSDPTAKRVLLTAYADVEAAIRAINEAALDHYLVKPWDPPETGLYPVVDDLLAQWQAEDAARTGEGGVRVIGHRWSERSHAVRDFLARNLVPYRALDIERDADARRLLEAAGMTEADVPVVVLEDGSALSVQRPPELAEHVGLATRASGDFFDLVIVGGGPAGLAAAVYGASEGLRTVLVEREAPGGQAGTSSRIENYLGFPTGLTGADLARRATVQARRFGAQLLSVQSVRRLRAEGPARIVELDDGTELPAHAVIIASGVSYRRLEVPGAADLEGRGVYYGAARTEALSCAEEEVVVVGGANSAGQAVMELAQTARKVTVLYRGDALSRGMSHYLVERVEAHPRVEVRTDAVLTACRGTDRLEAVEADVAGERLELPARAVFVFIGAVPRTDWLAGAVARDPRGFVLSGPAAAAAQDGAPPWPLPRDPQLLETSLPGVFVAGDVRSASIKRVASAVGEGSMAVQFVHHHLGERV